jgi:EmrB/QacA subfamily drug resistance transporter
MLQINLEAIFRDASALKYKWLVLTVTTIGVLMAGIDARIVIIGLPQVIHALGADAEQGIWISQAYIMGTIGILLLTGRFADLYGRKRVYTSGFLIFTIGSTLTSLATTPMQLIFFRIIQGMGAGIILTSSIAIITDATPPQELGYFLGINNLGFRFGAMAGLTISGVIITFLGDWRALFYINIPVGIIGTIWAHKTIKETPTQNLNGKNKFLSIDWAGFALFSTSISTLLLALTFAAYGIGSQTLTALFVVISILTFASFLFQERRSPNPLVNFNLLKIREYTGGLFALLINGLAWGAVLVLLSFYFQLVLGLSPLEAGVRIIPFDIAFLIAGPISGKLSDRFGHLLFTTTGILLSSFSLYLFSTVNMTTPYFVVLVYMVLFGVAMGLFSSPNMSAVMIACPADERGVGSAIRATFLNVGFAVSLNLAILIMSLTIPYSLVTQVASGYSTTLSTGKEMFLQSLNTTYLWLAFVNTLALIPSVLRTKIKQLH